MRRDFLPIIGGSFDRNSLTDKEAMRSDPSEDTEGAVGCAHIARHRVHGCPECRVFVTDEHGHEVAEVPLPADRARNFRTWSWLPNFPFNFGSQSPHIVAWSMAAVAIVVLAVTTVLVANRSNYQTASAPTKIAVVAVRFVAQATAEDISIFLDTYNGTILDVPRPGGFYRIRVSDQTLSQEELKKVAARMAQDRAVEMIAVPQ
jgi:hypothetical protein